MVGVVWLAYDWHGPAGAAECEVTDAWAPAAALTPSTGLPAYASDCEATGAGQLTRPSILRELGDLQRQLLLAEASCLKLILLILS